MKRAPGPRPKRGAIQVARDTFRTPFTRILEALLDRLPGGLAVALVDTQGEAVDYAGSLDPFDIKVAAAHLRILLDEVLGLRVLGEPREIVIRGRNRTFLGQSLPEGYALVVVFSRRAGFVSTHCAFALCARELCIEAGWTPNPTAAKWRAVDVAKDARGRPRAVEGLPVEVLGSILTPTGKPLGYRVRTLGGLELSLRREPKAHWYADETVQRLSKPAPLP